MAFGIILQVVTIVASMALTPSRGADRRRPGLEIRSGVNPTDLRLPIRIGYGRPLTRAPALLDYVQESALNKRTSDGQPRRVKVLSMGAGPNDGGDKEIWIDGVISAQRVDDDSPEVKRTLDYVGTAGRKYRFRIQNVVADSVVIYVNGTFFGTGEGDAGGGANSDSELQKTGESTAIKLFALKLGASHWVEVDSSWTNADAFGAKYRWGFFFPTKGLVPHDSVTAKIPKAEGVSVSRLRFRSGRRGNFFSTSVTVPAEDIHFARLENGDEFAWIDAEGWPNVEASLEKWTARVTYRVKPRVGRVVEEEGGSALFVFDEPRASSDAVTATMRSSNIEGAVRTEFRPGEKDQDPLPADTGLRASINVGQSLVAGSIREYSGLNDVDDLIVHIQSGPQGFFNTRLKGDTQGAFREAHRRLRFFLKRADAPDAEVAGTDPTKGWIRLAGIRSKTDAVHIDDRVTGTANFFFSLADLHAYATKGTDTTGNNLPRAAYDVRIVALDNPDTANGDTSDLVFRAVTEVVREKLSLPYHSTDTIEVVDPQYVSSSLDVVVAMKRRRVWVPDADAVYDADAGRPEPGEHKWTRNPVWCACDLATDPIFGAGRFYTWQRIPLAIAQAAAVFADEQVQNADGSFETRAECDIELKEGMSFADAIRRIFAGSQIMPIFTGGNIEFAIDEPGDVAWTFTDEHIVPRSFKQREPDSDAQTNASVYSYRDDRGMGEMVSDFFRLPGTDGETQVISEMEFPAVRRQSQCIRALALGLRQVRLQRREVEFAISGLRGLMVKPFQIVDLTCTAGQFTNKLFRVMQTETGSNLVTRLRLQEYWPEAYSAGFLGPNGGITPGFRKLPAPPDAAAETTEVDAAGVSARVYIRQALERLELKFISSSWRVDVGKLPPGAKGVSTYYREVGQIAWHRLEDSEKPQFIVSIPHKSNFEVKAYAYDQNRRIYGDPLQKTIKGIQRLSDRVDIGDEALPDPVVTQDGPTLAVEQKLRFGVDGTEYETEIRVSKAGVDTKDAWDQGFHETTRPVVVPLPPDEEEVKVHTRVHRKKDGARSDWKETTIPVASPEVAGVADHSNEFASGTMEQLDGVDVLEIDSGKLRMKAIDPSTLTVAGDTLCQPGDLLGTYWNPATYTTPTKVLPGEQDLQLQLWPEMDALTRATLNGNEMRFPPCWDEFRDVPFDPRLYELSLAGGEDQQPVIVKFKVATSDSATPTFTDADYEDWRPERSYPRVRSYSVRAEIWSFFDTRPVLLNIHVRRWVFCKSRPWKQYADAGEKYFDSTLTAPGDNFDIPIDGEGVDEVVIELDVEGSDPSAATVEGHFNLSGSNSVDLSDTGAYSLENGDRMKQRFRLLPKTGERRRIIVEHEFEYAAGGALNATSTTPRIIEWNDTATAITSLRITTDKTSGNGFAAGSRVRAWRKVHHPGA